MVEFFIASWDLGQDVVENGEIYDGMCNKYYLVLLLGTNHFGVLQGITQRCT